MNSSFHLGYTLEPSWQQAFCQKFSFTLFLQMEAEMRCTKILKLPENDEEIRETTLLPQISVPNTHIMYFFFSDTLYNLKCIWKCCSLWVEIKTSYCVKVGFPTLKLRKRKTLCQMGAKHYLTWVTKHFATSNEFCMGLWMRQRPKLWCG